MKMRLQTVVESKWFEWFIVAVIVVNAVTLGLEMVPSAMAAAGPLLLAIDKTAFGVFVAELLAKLYVYRGAYFKRGWNVFDFTIVVLTTLPYLGIGALGNLTILRSLRILRALRLLSAVPAFRQVIGTLGHSLSGVGAVGGVLFIAIYVFSVLASKLFGHISPNDFGTLGAALLSMFTIMTVEGWREIIDPIGAVYPIAYPFFVLYILGCAFVLFNLLITVLVSASEKQQEEERKREEQSMHELNAKIEDLRAMLERYLKDRG